MTTQPNQFAQAVNQFAQPASAGRPETFISLTSAGLSPELVIAVTEQGYSTPLPIQKKCHYGNSEGKRHTGSAQTGTGKTAGFSARLLQRLTKDKLGRSDQV